MPVQKKTVETEHWVTLCREISVFARYNSLYLRDVDAGIVVYFCLFDDDIVVALRYVGYPSTPEVPRLDPKNSFHSKQRWELKKENKKVRKKKETCSWPRKWSRKKYFFLVFFRGRERVFSLFFSWPVSFFLFFSKSLSWSRACFLSF